MRKFILVDQSIKDASGHHLEYALRVLKAAKAEGFETVLAVNKSCKSFNAQGIDVIDRAFSHTFWENVSCRKLGPERPGSLLLRILSQKWHGWKHTISEKRADIAYEFQFSQVGMAYTLLGEGASAVSLAKKYRIAGSGQELSFGAIVCAALYYGIHTAFDRISPRFRWLREFVAPVTSVIGKSIRIFFQTLRFFLFAVISPFYLAYFILSWKKVSQKPESFSTLFGRECRQLLLRIGVCEGDLVFVPTLSEIELAGIGDCSQKREFSGLSWHLLFRRNIFNGREPSYLGEMPTIKTEHLALAEFKQNFRFGEAIFYTDTIPLTEQHNLLGVYRFHTLPIPHDESLRKLERTSIPLTVSYIGDARDEKGFAYLARLVGDMRAAGYDENRLRFRFQSNFNIPLGDVGPRMSKAELALLPDNGVELLEGPFDSETYADIVNHSDIILVPYDEMNYYARSSGVFAEALVAGVPVVYPAKSWMGRELLEENFRYWQSLASRLAIGRWFLLKNPHKPESDAVVESSIIVTDPGFSASRQEEPSGSNEIIVSATLKNPVIFFRFRLQGPEPGRYAKLCIFETTRRKASDGRYKDHKKLSGSVLLDLRATEGTVPFRVKKPGNYSIGLELCPQGGTVEAIGDPWTYVTRIEYVLADSPDPIPEQAVGAGYDSIEMLEAALTEIIEHYAHYEQSCLTFSASWGAYHSAQKLVRVLGGSEERQ
ncbi:MAG: glycosyltransferase [Proteobacteria bacterium]|nr:glycosyltransferase [Pseudomonadota bacterium]HQR04675.1 glycosyltransferase [Rhodocyclaceae bacterium]